MDESPRKIKRRKWILTCPQERRSPASAVRSGCIPPAQPSKTAVKITQAQRPSQAHAGPMLDKYGIAGGEIIRFPILARVADPHSFHPDPAF